jgi:unsaturated rhamnogalacturonyl hydrolase
MEKIMKRRNFLKKSSLIGSSIFLSSFSVPSHSLRSPYRARINDDKITKVKQAMLSMQRASWEQGVAAQALLELGDDEMVILMAKESVLRQTSEGRLAVVYTDNGVTDPAASGEALLYSAQVTQDSSLKQAADKMLEYLLDKAPKNEAGIIYHTLDAPEIWIDSMYMCPPFLAAAGHFNDAIKQVNGIRHCLWNATDRLYSHRWNDREKIFVNKNYWGVGNGWAIAGISRVLKKLPSNMKSVKEQLVHYVKDAIDGCLEHVRSDYLFHNVINDKNTFVETNLSQMIAYTIFRGVTEKWLDKSYLDYAYKMRNVVHQQVDQYGYVQNVCGAPFFDSPGRATEGQAFFLLMEAAYKNLSK